MIANSQTRILLTYFLELSLPKISFIFDFTCAPYSDIGIQNSAKAKKAKIFVENFTEEKVNKIKHF